MSFDNHVLYVILYKFLIFNFYSGYSAVRELGTHSRSAAVACIVNNIVVCKLLVRYQVLYQNTFCHQNTSKYCYAYH